jgi:hypothetical protein
MDRRILNLQHNSGAADRCSIAKSATSALLHTPVHA